MKSNHRFLLQKQEPQPISNQKQQDHLRNRHNKLGNLRDQAMKELNLPEDKQLLSQQRATSKYKASSYSSNSTTTSSKNDSRQIIGYINRFR